MYNRYPGKYKNRYTEELTKLLLARLPPKNGRAFGLTGNLLPVIIKVTSSRKFNRMKGWYYTEYSTTHAYARLTERMDLKPIDNELIYRLWMRYRTLNIDEKQLKDADTFAHYKYFTIIAKKNFNSLRDKIYLFYLNDKRLLSLKDIQNIRVKTLIFRRFGKIIVNFITDNPDAVIHFFKSSN